MELDEMLQQLGQFGKFQALCFTMLLFPVLLSGFRSTEYIFTTMNIPHRCRISQCEDASGTTPYNPPWLANAVPFSNGQPAACQRFAYNSSADTTAITANVSQCPSQLFLHSSIEMCHSWVFAEPARTIAYDFNLLCPSDFWKLTFLGSYPVFFSFVGIPLSGFISDRLGRKSVLVWGSVIISVSGLIRSFSVNYEMLAAFEMFDGLISGAIFGPAFVLGLETLSPKKRLLGSMLINMYFPLGEVVLACLMWWVQDWRSLLRIFYTPMLLVVSLHWWLPESVRWLYTQRRFGEVEKVLIKIAELNKTTDELPTVIESLNSSKHNDSATQAAATRFRLVTVFKSRVLMWRFGVCTICWVATIFTYYGISQDVTSFGSNRYVSFLLVSLVEMPAYVASLWAPDWEWLGRKGAMAWTFILGGLSCLTMMFVKSDQVVASLLLFLFGKFFSTLTVTVIYLYTAELFPTELRHSMLSLCSMFGRIGSILSQQMPLLSMYVDPMLVFGLVSLVGGVLSFTCPETLHTTLPDTIEEAEHIGVNRKPPQ